MNSEARDNYRLTREILVPSLNTVFSTLSLLGTLRVNAADPALQNAIYRHERSHYKNVSKLEQSGLRLQRIAGIGFGGQSFFRAGGHLYSLFANGPDKISQAAYLDLGASLLNGFDSLWTQRGFSQLVAESLHGALGSLRM
ncbi:MAG: hypothetical protein Q7S68_05280, partial [Deltaproteobacteria bacterium]|nr:hypothetical protein [Deltaproteobacteria bacterium]